jgi:hypothetical protein
MNGGMTMKFCCGAAIRLGLALSAFGFFTPAKLVQDLAAQPGQPIRYAVAHNHKFSWCYGYLYIDGDSISYVVDHPSKFKDHEFKVKRSDLMTVGRWRVLGVPLDVLELKFGKSTYHLTWLQDEQEVQKGPERRTQPPDSAPPDTLIAAIKDPASVEHASVTAPEAQPASTPTPADASAANPAARGHIGIVVNNLTPSQTQSLGANGAVVKQLEPDGPATQAGR